MVPGCVLHTLAQSTTQSTATGKTPAAPGAPANGDGSTTGGGSTNGGGSTSGAHAGGGPLTTSPVLGAVNGTVTTALPALPALSNVVATLGDDSASISFDPVDGARDYRVYVLPPDGDISVAGDGGVTVHNATYRCAGDRESAFPVVDSAPYIASDAIHTQVDQQMVDGQLRTLADATLGYVYTVPAPGLIPVYVLGESDANADTTCYFARWSASRVKKYTTSETERAQYLADYARDDGIAFYVPATASATTTQVYEADDSPDSPYEQRYYFSDGAEATARSSKTPAFVIEATAAPGTQPLMRVFYSNECGQSHDELAVGSERFNRIYRQGDTLPWWSLLWTGVTGPTTLVVEALDSGCPFQGHIAPLSMHAINTTFGSTPLDYQPWFTIADIRAATASGEVFINGQHGLNWDFTTGTTTTAAAPFPKAIARTFVDVAPNPAPKMDFLATFPVGSTLEEFSNVTPTPPGSCGATEGSSATYDLNLVCIASDPTPGPTQNKPQFAMAPMLGELWVTYSDGAGDTNGKFRLTPHQKATMADDSFVHVTMEVDAYSTARRYPQIIISDVDTPVQGNLQDGHSLVIQPRGEIGTYAYPIDYELQICNLRTWDVNQQCPVYDLHHITAAGTQRLAPNDEVAEHASVDHRAKFDVFASTQRVYLFLENQPYACADLPSAGPPPAGPVTVTWGDVLYHSAVDTTFAFHAAHMQIETRRHFDNLGFSSGVGAPDWDETRLPCVAPITL